MSRLASVVLGALLACFALVGDAWAQGAGEESVSKEACADAYHAAQELKLEGKLVTAGERATFCAQSGCPGFLRDDCLKWAEELSESTPSIVVTATDATGDVSDVRVFIDGELVASALDGKAILLDPGSHVLRFEREGEPPKEMKLIAASGVKNRAVAIRFGGAEDDSGSSGGSGSVEDDDELPIAGLVLVGVGVAGLAVFAALAAVGTSEVDEMRDGCGRTASCAEGDVDAAKTKIIAGDIALAGGVVALGIGAALIIAHYVSEDDDAGTESAVRWGIGAGPHGGSASVSFSF